MSAPVSPISTDRSGSPLKQKELCPAEAISIVSAPVSSVSTAGMESPAKKKEPQPVDINRHSRKISGKGVRRSISPGSASVLRRTPRLQKVLFLFLRKISAYIYICVCVCSLVFFAAEIRIYWMDSGLSKNFILNF